MKKKTSTYQTPAQRFVAIGQKIAHAVFVARKRKGAVNVEVHLGEAELAGFLAGAAELGAFAAARGLLFTNTEMSILRMAVNEFVLNNAHAMEDGSRGPRQDEAEVLQARFDALWEEAAERAGKKP